MEKKTECEIVQDLLYGYTDQTLNPESKKLVEKHLSECKECQKKFEEIRQSIEDDNSEVKQIDYLKKIRKRNRTKIIFTVFGVILFILLAIYLRKLVIINNLYGNAMKTINNNNFHKEFSQYTADEEKIISNEYYKDGQFKEITNIYKNDELTFSITEYQNSKSNEKVIFDEINKRVVISKDEVDNSFQVSPPIQNSTILSRMIYAFASSVENVKNTYIFTNAFDKDFGEIVINKETGLPIKETNRSMYKKVKDAELLGEWVPRPVIIGYEFGHVTDEDVKIPSFDGYAVEERN